MLLTCDTEVGELGLDKEGAFEIFVEGKVEGQEVGYKLINKIASQYKVKVQHFVDVYPYKTFEEKKFAKLCNSILESGHHLGLHTHPSGFYDRNRKFMWEYTKSEQRKIIEHGKKKIKEWTGIEIKFHRAGGYGANNDTLKALYENGVFLDSSFFYKHQNCKINYPFANKPEKIEKVWEIPITVYEKKIKLLFKTRQIYQKLDFRYGSSAKEIIEVVRKAPSNTLIVLFLHSFNFLNLPYNFKRKEYGKITVNTSLIKEFDFLLSELTKLPDVKFTSFKEIFNNLSRGCTFENFIVSLEVRGSVINFTKNKVFQIFGWRGSI